YESNFNVVKSEAATFFQAFDHASIWSKDDNGSGYDTVMLGSDGDLKIDLDPVEGRLNGSNHAPSGQSMQRGGFKSALDLLATYAGQAGDLAPWLQKAEINRDRNLRLQYLAGMAPNVYLEHAIYNDMVTYRRFPENLFTGSDGERDSL